MSGRIDTPGVRRLQLRVGLYCCKVLTLIPAAFAISQQVLYGAPTVAVLQSTTDTGESV